MDIDICLPKKQSEKEKLQEALAKFHAFLIRHDLDKLDVDLSTKEKVIEEINRILMEEKKFANK